MRVRPVAAIVLATSVPAALALVACFPAIVFDDGDGGGDAGDHPDGSATDARLDTAQQNDGGARPYEPTTLTSSNEGTCLLEDGSVVCWGANHGSSLGTTQPSYEWQPPTRLSLTSIDEIALGHRHACALTRRPARLQCWGTVPGGTAESAIPQDVVLPQALLDAGIDHVSLGLRHSCVLSFGASPSRVWCWGNNVHGQVGAGAVGAVSSAPAAVTGLERAVQVSAGDDHTCAVLESGSIKCWGRSDFFQAGGAGRTSAGGVLSVITPNEFPPPSGERYVQVSAGDACFAYPTYPGFTCARTDAGKIYCWGSDAGGRLALGGALPAAECVADAGAVIDGGSGHEVRGACRVPILVPGVLDAVELHAGGGHACLRRRGGAVLCWGHNGGGQVGTGVRSDAVQSPSPVLGPGGSGTFTSTGPMEMGKFHSCARNDGGIWCWGIGRFVPDASSPLNDYPIRMNMP